VEDEQYAAILSESKKILAPHIGDPQASAGVEQQVSIQHKVCISLDDAVEQQQNFQGTDFDRWPASSISDVTEELKDFIHRPHTPDPNHPVKLRQCACYLSHHHLWECIVSNKLSRSVCDRLEC
jgi:hypothetical protein